MKSKNYKEMITRKDLNQDDRLKKNKSVRTRMLFISLICLMATGIFSFCLVGTVHYINIKTGIGKSISLEKIAPDDNSHRINIDIDEIFYITQKGHSEINRAKIIELIIVVILTMIFYTWLFGKLTDKLIGKILGMCNALDNMAMGEYDVILDDSGNDELARMAADINIISSKFNEILENVHNDEAAKNELITSIAHDLRTPITSIIGYLDIIENKKLDEETKNKYIKISYDKSLRLEHLIEDLFTYTKFSLGQYPVNLSVINLGMMMEQLIEEFYPQLEDASLECGYSCSKVIMVEADGELIARLFANLLSNSIKYGRDGKNIDISVDADSSMAYVKVTNYGQIIPQDELARIFEKFYRVESSRSRSTGGTGLGLAIVKQIVNLHNGTIEAQSDADGTVFTVGLPLR